MQIYHNPRCRKSRETLELIKANGINPEIVLYLEEVPTKEMLKSILEKLQIPAEKLLRKGEKVFKENYKGQDHSNEDWIDIMIANPKLIERPIVIDGDKAILGRPPENVLDLI